MKRFQSDEQQALLVEPGSTRTPSPESSDVPDIALYSPFELPSSLAPPHEFDESESMLVVDKLLQLLANPSKAKRANRVVLASTMAPMMPLTVPEYIACSSWQPVPAFGLADQPGLRERYQENWTQWAR